MNFKTALAVMTLFALLAPARAADDQATPKATLKTFALATRSADRDKLRACLHAADGNEARMADAMVEATSALARLRLAAIKQFGEMRVRDLNAGIPGEQEIRQIEAASEKIDGDQATVTIGAGPKAGGNVHLVRIDGQWKIPVGQGLAGKSPAEVDAAIASLHSTARIVGTVTDEIASGKYKTASEATAALAARVRSAKPAASQPAN